jgi:beta-carotene 3-hydroxylase
MLKFFLLVMSGFVGMEVFSYFVHRFLFHGILWRIHITHHLPRRFVFELNDVFSLIFAVISIGLIVSGSAIGEAVGIGIAIYGVLYFIVHDVFTHRRFLVFTSKNKTLLTLRTAHQRHHQSVEKQGQEPFGLFFFDYRYFLTKTPPRR